MKKYIGTKTVQAEPAYKCKDGSVIKNNGVDAMPAGGQYGYKVVYPDGYESFCPRYAFEEAYRPTDGVSFGLALEAAKKGKGFRLPQWKPDVIIRTQFPDEHSKMTAPYLYVESRFGRVLWKETMIELFSDKWQIVD